MAIKATFIEPMLLLRTEKLPEGPEFIHELKLDGFRSLAVKTGGKVHLRSRNDKDFNGKYPSLVKALADMPDETVLDGEVVVLDAEGRPSFNLLQNSAAGMPLHYFIGSRFFYFESRLGCPSKTTKRGNRTDDFVQRRPLGWEAEAVRGDPDQSMNSASAILCSST